MKHRLYIRIYTVAFRSSRLTFAPFDGGTDMAKSECSGCTVMEEYKRQRRSRCGTVFVYLLKQMGSNNEWMTLVHKRSNKVHRGKNSLATPGGSVRREDLNHWQFSPHSHPCFCKQKLVMVVNRAEAACVSFSTTLYCFFFLNFNAQDSRAQRSTTLIRKCFAGFLRFSSITTLVFRKIH